MVRKRIALLGLAVWNEACLLKSVSLQRLSAALIEQDGHA